MYEVTLLLLLLLLSLSWDGDQARPLQLCRYLLSHVDARPQLAPLPLSGVQARAGAIATVRLQPLLYSYTTAGRPTGLVTALMGEDRGGTLGTQVTHGQLPRPAWKLVCTWPVLGQACLFSGSPALCSSRGPLNS